MKNIFYKIVFTVLLNSSFLFVSAQTFEIRTVENEIGYLTVQMRETSGTGTPTTATNIVDITFVVRYPAGAVDLELLCSTNDYNIMDGLNGEQTEGGYDYHYWNASNTPFNPPNNWTTGEWEDIAVFKATGATGSGLFEIAPNNWDGRSLNWNQEGTDFTPSINGDVTYSYPTLVYNYVWKGGSAPPPNFKKWNVSGNWNNECGSSAGAYPWGGGNENVYIPSGLSNYPEQTSGGDDYAFICDYLLIENGAHITVPDLSGQTSTYTYFRVNNDAIINGKLYLPALGYATIVGSTQIDAAEGIEVQADATGVGSFIDNGITYGTSGSGKVQTYLTNTATAGSFHQHTVGPTVDVGSAGGATLSAFDLVAGSTYAYDWDEAQPVADGWQNIYSNSYLVATGDGIALSTTDATDHTLEMTGEFITGSTSSPALTYSNNHYELISNPYPSSIDFDAFAAANSSDINNGYWIWNPGTGNYEARAGGTGSQQYVQVGQAFFVETKSGVGTVQFTNALRTHSSDAFRDILPNMLTMNVSGGDMGYSDELIVRFTEDATNGYDVNLDAEKWNSMYDDATMIRSIAEDGSELAINALPLEGLQGDMVSVPVNFQCGYTAQYTFDFEGIDSFEAGNEVWLEDKKDNDKWIYLNNNPHYTFTATSYEPNDRFIIHFFGPTSINDKDEAKVDIYSWRQYAYIKNVTNEKIKKVSIYNMAGSLVSEREVPNGQKLSKIWVSDHMAYYIVQVITESGVYTNKILITK